MNQTSRCLGTSDIWTTLTELTKLKPNRPFSYNSAFISIIYSAAIDLRYVWIKLVKPVLLCEQCV